MIPRQAIGQFSQVDPPEYADANPQVCDIVTCIWEAGLVIIHARNFVRSETRHHYALVCIGMHWCAYWQRRSLPIPKSSPNPWARQGDSYASVELNKPIFPSLVMKFLF